MSVCKCDMCGAEKTDGEFYDRPTGLSHYCIECEQNLYDRLSENSGVGAYIGLFATCASLNVPFWPEKLPKVTEFLAMDDRWVWYNEAIAEEVHGENGLVRGFFDGETNILRIFGTGLSQKDTAKFIEVTQAHESAKPGTREQRERWGEDELCEKVKMTDKIYAELDRQYENWCGRYKGQTITPQLADSIVKICRWNMVTEHLVRVGEYVSAQKVQKMVDDLMASEQMRKKDERPIENFRFDACVDALEHAGLMENNGFKTFEGTLEAFADHFLTKKKYAYTGDVLDQVIADIYNNARLNADLPPEDTLPGDLEPHDDFGELAEEATEDEIEQMRYAGATKIYYEKDAPLTDFEAEPGEDDL